MSEAAVTPRADRRLFSLHEEEDVVEIPPHRHQIEYLESNLRAELPDRFVAGNIGVYWVPGQFREPWAGPDVLVAKRPPEPKPRVYLLWEDGPIQFIAEVASDRTRRSERKKREQTYRVDLQVAEYLYIDLDRHQLELWRLQGGQYHRVGENLGRLHSQELNLWFAWDRERDFVRIWTTDGRVLLTKEEDLELQRRLAAERDAAREAAARAREQAQEAQARAAELAAEVERLRRLAGESAEDTAL